MENNAEADLYDLGYLDPAPEEVYTSGQRRYYECAGFFALAGLPLFIAGLIFLLYGDKAAGPFLMSFGVFLLYITYSVGRLPHAKTIQIRGRIKDKEVDNGLEYGPSTWIHIGSTKFPVNETTYGKLGVGDQVTVTFSAPVIFNFGLRSRDVMAIVRHGRQS